MQRLLTTQSETFSSVVYLIHYMKLYKFVNQVCLFIGFSIMDVWREIYYDAYSNLNPRYDDYDYLFYTARLLVYFEESTLAAHNTNQLCVERKANCWITLMVHLSEGSGQLFITMLCDYFFLVLNCFDNLSTWICLEINLKKFHILFTNFSNWQG